jgi:DNA-binding MarR family transcriptional regulator
MSAQPADRAGDAGRDATASPVETLAEELSHELGRHSRLLHAMRSHMASWTPAGLDWSAFALLMSLVKFGPSRQGELADLSLLDPSTVSRHVGQLVRAGLVERRPDPADGRAVQLVASATGHEMAAELVSRRQKLVTRAMADWDTEDVRTFVHLFARFNDSLDAYRPQLVRVAPRAPVDLADADGGPAAPAARTAPDPAHDLEN